jgi:glucose/arabinose dehydrogenase
MSPRLPGLGLALAGLVAPAVPGQEPPPAAAEDRYWRVETLPLPDEAVLEVGGIDFLADGRMVVSTRRGQVWIVEGALGPEPLDRARCRLFAEGLFEGLGLRVVDGRRIFVLQRHELSELSDEDGDGRCDRVRTVTDAFGLSGNYHEFAFGLPVDRDGNFYVALNLGFFEPYWYLGRSAAPHRGWVLRVAPDGTVTPWASGFRSPNGISLSPDGELFVTDNQGDWVPACPVHVVERGRHYGHPASLDWRPEYRDLGRRADWYEPATDVRREAAAVWLPYDLSRSVGNLAWDRTEGRFGPFAGQAFAAELTNGLVLRLALERVRGRWQGAAIAFRPGVGAANRIAFAPDGSLWCGLTSRGWGGEGAAQGLSRVRFTGETPMEMRTVGLRQDGFEIEFTRPLAQALAPGDLQVRASQYRYRFWWKYGSPEDEVRALPVTGLTLSADRRRLRLSLGDLRPAFVTRVEFEGLVGDGGHPLLHPRFDYTIVQLPDGPETAEQVSTAVPAPKSREQLAERAVYLSDLGQTMNTWQGEGWELGSEPGLDPEDPRRLRWGAGRHYLVRPTGSAEALHSVPAFGDCTIRGEVMFAREARCELELPSGDRLPLAADGAAAGVWLPFEVVYRAPRADGAAQVLAVQVGERRRDGPVRPLAGTGARGGIGLCDPRGAGVAFKNLMVVPDDLAVRDDGSFAAGGGWRPGRGDWRFEDGRLIATDGLSSAVRAVGAGGFAFETDVRLAPGFAAELRLGCSELGLGGHAVTLNRSGPSPRKTGSVAGAVELRHSLVAYDDTWFRVRAEVRHEGEVDRVRVLVDGVETFDGPLPAAAGRGGHLAITRLNRDGRLELRHPWLEQSRD